MFTGIVEEIGKVVSKTKVSEGFLFRIKSKQVIKKLKKSDSVSINGVCHTVTSKTKAEFEITSVHETLSKTNIGLLKAGSNVNLEKPLEVGNQIGGHFVLGHIDCTGTISKIRIVNPKDKKSMNWEYHIAADKKFSKFIINVGSIAVNGVSLTVAQSKKPKRSTFEFKVAIIPYTYKHTTFSKLREGDKVNLEFDFLGKYVINILEQRKRK